MGRGSTACRSSLIHIQVAESRNDQRETGARMIGWGIKAPTFGALSLPNRYPLTANIFSLSVSL
jgi:hypothetical protein